MRRGKGKEGRRACEQRPRRPYRQNAARRLVLSTDLIVGWALLSLVLVAASLAPVITRSPIAQDLRIRLSPPLWYGEASHGRLLGTDALGRDIFSRIVWGSHVSLMVGFCAVIIAGLIGIPVGIVAALRGGWLDTVLMRLADMQLAFPDMLLALAIIAIAGPTLFNVVIAISITTWVRYARVARASTLVVKELTYIEAARALGARRTRLVLRHVLPNIATPLIVLATLQVGKAIIAESALGFLGLGVPPPTPSWGNMLAEGREYLMVAWWVAMFPGFAILIAVLGVNLLGNGLRVALDPKLKPRL